MADEKDNKKKETIDYEADAGMGLEELGTEDFQIPFLNLLQSTSDELKRGHEKYNTNARQGMLLSTQSGICYDEVHIIPIRMNSRNVEWKPREIGGGLVAKYTLATTPKDIHTDADGNIARANGNVIVPTYQYLCRLGEEDWNKVILLLHRSQRTPAQKWNTFMQAKRQASFANVYKASVSSKSNNKGSWYIWKFEWVTQQSDLQLYNACKEDYHTMIDFLPDRLLTYEENGGNGNSNGEVL